MRLKTIGLGAALLASLTGCESLVVKPQDNFAVSTGKVFSRTLIGVGTLGFSELGMAQIKRAEEDRPRILASGTRNRALLNANASKVLVWGNDSIAVARVSEALQVAGDTIIDRGRVRASSAAQNIQWTYTSEDAPELLNLAKTLGVDSIVFADVTGRSETRTHVQNRPGMIMPMGNMYLAAAPTSEAYSEQLHHLRVRIQSISVSEGAVRWSGTAVYDKPVSNPDPGVGYLTDAAVARALCPNDKDFRWVEPAPWVAGGCLPVK